MALPMPEPAPVTMATFPSSLIVTLLIETAPQTARRQVGLEVHGMPGSRSRVTVLDSDRRGLVQGNAEPWTIGQAHRSRWAHLDRLREELGAERIGILVEFEQPAVRNDAMKCMLAIGRRPTKRRAG